MKWHLCSSVVCLMLILPLVAACAPEPTLLTPTQADDIALGLLLPKELASPTIVYRYRSVLALGDTITTAYVGEAQELDSSVSFTAEHNTYFYFVDYFNGFFYAHPVEYIFVRASDGTVTSQQTDWWPRINGEDVFFTKEQKETARVASFPAQWGK